MNRREKLLELLKQLYSDREAELKGKYFFEDTQHLDDQEFKKIYLQFMMMMPLEYITGIRHFIDLKLKVNRHVLIPRPETEELVMLITEKADPQQVKDILDIGSGSGAIALALKKNMPDVRVTALENDPKAVEVLRFNSDNLSLHVKIIEQNLFEYKSHVGYDLIVSNPPYISRKEVKWMDLNTLKFEPEQALFASDSLVFYRQIINLAQKNLNKGGYLFLECNEFNATRVAKLMDGQIENDLSGKQRFVWGQY